MSTHFWKAFFITQVSCKDTSQNRYESTFSPVNNTSVRKYWKILFYPPNTDTGTFYRGSTDIDTDAQYPKLNTDTLLF